MQDSKIEQHITESASPSTTPKTTPKTTPRLSLKFRKDKDAAAVPGEDKLFDWGKSKFTSKHEVVKRGKEVEVKLEPLKLAKDETLKVVVIRKFLWYQKNPPKFSYKRSY